MNDVPNDLAVSAQHAGPVAGAERLFTLDLIRGVALLGILIMNMPGFATSFYSGMSGSDQWINWWDEWTAVLRNTLFSGKFNSMFSLLFGIGFTIQLNRLLERRGPDGVRLYVRRLIALFAFGAIHMLVFWTGDVLHMYALLGVLLLLLRNASDRTIYLLIALCMLFPVISGLYKMTITGAPDVDHVEQAFSAWLTSNDYAYGRGSFSDAMREHTRETWFLYTDPASFEFTLSFYVQLTTTMLLGFLIGRHRLMQRIEELLPKLIRLQYWSLGIGIGSALLLAYGEKTVSPIDVSAKSIVVSMSYVICRIALMTFYVTTLIRLAGHRHWRERLASIALVGRMPLTNYLLQTAIATTIFYGWGLGFWNEGGPLIWFVLALAIYFIAQVPFSRWWLARFQYGPMEYLWRVLTYGRAMSGQLRRS
ncbi:MAG TPA: DUF418 domain-containing protein [Steroidobacteraceae bacterium]|nr:DUF418 domain-containing protein [Steroidobacteraceae bacterium]